MKFLRPIIILLAVYITFLVLLYVRQDRQIFFPTQLTFEQARKVTTDLRADEVTIRADDGVHLEGWFFSDGSEEPRPTVLFFGGNAMRLDRMAYTLGPLRDEGVNILLIDYRGYGLSEGKPSTDLMKTDAEKLFDAAASHPFVDSENIIAWGISLGSGIATHLASVKPVSKVILFSPFTSTEDVARALYPFVPVSLLLKHKLENLALAPSLSQPALIVEGTNDKELYPAHDAEKIANAWGGEVELLVLPNRGHNDLLEDEEVWRTLVEFVAQ